MSNKKTLSLILSLFLVTILTGCPTKTSKSLTFSVDTGDKVKVELDTSDGLDLTSNDNTFIIKDDKTVVTGIFMHDDVVEEYLKEAPKIIGVKVIDSDDNMIFYEYENMYYYIIDLGDTGVTVSGDLSKESLSDVIDNLEFTVE